VTGVCPCCGYNLARLEDFELGDLRVSGEFGMVTWRGIAPHLTGTERTIVIALAMAKGGYLRRRALTEAGGFDERQDPDNMLSVFLLRIREAFRKIDPTFDLIESRRGIGLRWKNDQPEEAMLCSIG